MRRHPWILTVLTLGCTTADVSSDRKPQVTTTDTATTLTTGTTGGTMTGTTTTGTTLTTFDCTAQPQGPYDITEYDIQTQEDFDFAASGHMVFQEGIAVVGADTAGAITVLSAGAAGDPRGVHGLADGRIVIMSPWDGQIKIADPATGGLVTMAGGLNTPNGVEIGENDRIYFTTYGEAGWVDVDAANHEIIHEWANFSTANGVALSLDMQTLYVAAPSGNETTFVFFERQGPDDWGPAQVLQSVSGMFSAIDIDVCGNLYTVDYSGGNVYRIDPDGNPEVITTLQGTGWAYSAMRFGPGHGGWDRDKLYVSSRNDRVFGIDIGIPGRPHPTSP